MVSKIKAHESLEPLKNYNLAQLYLIFDMPEKAIEMGDKIIANDYDTRDGKKF